MTGLNLYLVRASTHDGDNMDSVVTAESSTAAVELYVYVMAIDHDMTFSEFLEFIDSADIRVHLLPSSPAAKPGLHNWAESELFNLEGR